MRGRLGCLAAAGYSLTKPESLDVALGFVAGSGAFQPAGGWRMKGGTKDQTIYFSDKTSALP